MRVEQVMTPRVRCCRPGDSLDHAAQIMWSRDCGCVPVCADDADHPIGVITDRDICMCALFGARPLSQLTVREAMSDQPLYVCQPEDSLAQAEELMRQARVRRLPVVDSGGALIGVISLADLAREAARQQELSDREITETEVNETLAQICAPAVPVSRIDRPAS